MITRAFLSALVALIAFSATSDSRDAVAGTPPSAASSPDDRVLAGRKMITVYADSEAAAFAEANRKNPG